MLNLQAKLAKFCTELTYNKIPENVVKKVKLCILDYLGNVLGSLVIEESERVAEFVRSLGEKEEATVLGFNFKTSCRSAAFANGSLSEILEFQDGFYPGFNHPSSVVLPAVFALSEFYKINGKDLITAVIVGYEVANRISEAVCPSHDVKGFTPTGTTGAFAAAVATGKVLGFNKNTMLNSLGIAGFLLPISLIETLRGGYTIKIIHGGQASKVGIESAMLAQQGFRGHPEIIEGSAKFPLSFCRVTSENPKLEEMLKDLGEHYTIMDVYFKPFPCCARNHVAAQITLDLVKINKIDYKDVEEVVVEIDSFTASHQGIKYTKPLSSFIDCQFSLPYIISSAIIDRDFGIYQLSRGRINDPKIHNFAKKVKVHGHKGLDKMYPEKRPSIVKIWMKGGRQYSGRADYPKGDPNNPFTKKELFEKFKKQLGCYTIDPQKIEEIIYLIMNIEKLKNISRVMKLLVSFRFNNRNSPSIKV